MKYLVPPKSYIFVPWHGTGFLVGGVASSVLLGCLQTTLAFLLGKIFNTIADFGSGDMMGLETLPTVCEWCVVLVAVGGASLVVHFAFMFSWSVFGEQQVHYARKEVFSGLLHKEMAWLETQPDGIESLLTRTHT